jgi:hypothetical protein
MLLFELILEGVSSSLSSPYKESEGRDNRKSVNCRPELDIQSPRTTLE